MNRGSKPLLRRNTGTSTALPSKSSDKLPASKLPKYVPSELIEKYKNGDIHPISALYQLSQVLQLKVDLKETAGNVSGFYFAFCAVIDGIEYKIGMGPTKKDARAKAAELALQDFLPTLENKELEVKDLEVCPPPLPVKELVVREVSFRRVCHERKNADDEHIPYTVRKQFSEITESFPKLFGCWSTVAAFIIQTGDGFEVVAMGTGDINTAENFTPNGRLLHDSHAVVTARRSLMRYLYRHLLLFFSKTSALVEKSIFQLDEEANLLRLKGDVSLHLYLNQLPKGAAQIPSSLRLGPLSISAFDVNYQIGLHVSVQGKVFSVFSLEQMATRVVSMSATDKLTQWLVVGFQGALLSHFLEPIYVSSIIVGDPTCNTLQGMEIALKQRADGITPILPIYYCMSPPRISRVTTTQPDQIYAQESVSMNWAQGDVSVELVDGLQGKATENSPFKSGPGLASRLCKAAMLSRFKLVAREAGRDDLLRAVSYREAKMMSKSYQEAKNVLKSYLSQKGYGCWVVKSPVSDHFSM